MTAFIPSFEVKRLGKSVSKSFQYLSFLALLSTAGAVLDVAQASDRDHDSPFAATRQSDPRASGARTFQRDTGRADAARQAIGAGRVVREPGRSRGYAERGHGGRDYGRGFGRSAGVGMGLGLAGAVVPLLMRPRAGAAYVDDDEDVGEPVYRPRRRAPKPEPRYVVEPRQQPPGRPPRQPVQQAAAPRGVSGMPPAAETRFVPDEVMFETRPGTRTSAVTTIAQRYRLTRIGEQRFSLIDATIHRYRVAQNATVRGTIAALERDPRIASVQPNYVYSLQQQAEPAKTDTVAVQIEAEPAKDAPPPISPTPVSEAPKPTAPPQYVVDVMHLSDAHRMARGERTLVAVIDSGIDGSHQELAGAVAKSLDTLGDVAPEPEAHGTSMAGAIVAHSLLQSVAPGAQILAARAFSSNGKGAAQGTSFHIAKGVDWAYDEKARIINMSFAGPKDPLLTRMLAAAAQKKMILIAAAGNAGPASPPLYPAADPNVIAVTATDAGNQLYAGANRGAYIGVAAPGVDVLVAAPKGAYEFTTGTSVATAHVSGVIALMLEKYPSLDSATIRRALTDSGMALSASNDNVARLADPAAALRKLAGMQQAKSQ